MRVVFPKHYSMTLSWVCCKEAKVNFRHLCMFSVKSNLGDMTNVNLKEGNKSFPCYFRLLWWRAQMKRYPERNISDFNCCSIYLFLLFCEITSHSQRTSIWLSNMMRTTLPKRSPLLHISTCITHVSNTKIAWKTQNMKNTNQEKRTNSFAIKNISSHDKYSTFLYWSNTVTGFVG